MKKEIIIACICFLTVAIIYFTWKPQQHNPVEGTGKQQIKWTTGCNLTVREPGTIEMTMPDSTITVWANEPIITIHSKYNQLTNSTKLKVLMSLKKWVMDEMNKIPSTAIIHIVGIDTMFFDGKIYTPIDQSCPTPSLKLNVNKKQ